MRDYRKRIAQYAIDKKRLGYLKAYCRTSNEERLRVVADTMQDAFGDDSIQQWLWHSIVGSWKWAEQEAHGIPCSRDSFFFYKAKFYYVLHEKIGATLFESRGSMISAEGSDEK